MRAGAKLGLFAMLALLLVSAPAARADDVVNAAKARSLVNAAINMTDSQQAVKLLWQATDIDPKLQDAYIYLGLYYNSRSQFDQVIKVYKKLIKNDPNNVSANLNIGEAYMSFSPPRGSDALPYYRKAYKLDPSSAFAALRIGEILAQQGNRGAALPYLKKAATSGSSSPAAAAEARKILNEIGAM
jgi:tetratricopeptide (TPR) repeat protein